MSAIALERSQAGASSRIKVMIVDDAVVVRGLLTRWIEEQDDMEVVGSVQNGRIAVDRLKNLDPDVVILDVEMPEMDGITALSHLMKQKPNRIVIMASTLTTRNAEISLRALTLGARDYIPKPEGNHGVTTSVDFRRDLIAKIRALGGRAVARRSPAGDVRQRPPSSRTAARGHISTRRRRDQGSAPTSGKLRQMQMRPAKVIAIGSSTGGPQALMTVLGEIGKDLARYPILIAQHMPATFTPILADHLRRCSGLEAKEGEHGETLRTGTIYVAPGGKHMVIERSGANPVIALNDGPPVNFCKPAVDPLFDSIADVFGGGALAVVLTGMGHDGAKGAVSIANAGGNVLVQDEASSVVWGMPGATYEAGAACAMGPLNAVGSNILKIARGGK